MVDCLQIRTVEKVADKGPQEVKAAEPNRRPSPPKTVESRDSPHCAATGRPEPPAAPEHLPQDEPAGKAPRAAKNPSPKARRGSTNTPSPPAGRAEKKQRAASKAPSPSWDGTDRSAAAAHSHHAEQTRCGSARHGSARLGSSSLKVSFHFFSLTPSVAPTQAGAGAEEAEGRAAGQPAERAGAAQPRLQPDQQREEPEARGLAAQAVQHAAPEQVSFPECPSLAPPCGRFCEITPRRNRLAQGWANFLTREV